MGILYVVGTPIGNLNDITFRAVDVLKNVDYIACEDTRQSLKLLNHYDIKKKLVSYHKFNENSKSEVVLNDLLSGKNIALISDAGTPCISDPGYVLIRKCHENGITVLAIPGACATIASLSISGIDTSDFSFIGFLPTEKSKLVEKLNKIKEDSINTFVIYESPKRILKLFSKLIDIFPNCLVYVASDLTKIHEKGYYGTIELVYKELTMNEKIEKGEYVIIIHKNNKREIEEQINNLSIESMIIDVIIKKKCTIKEAIEELRKSNNYKKNELYSASLNLKNIISKIL